MPSGFDGQNATLRADLEAAQKRLSDYQQKQGIVATDDRLDLENARLAELSTQLSVAQAQKVDSRSRQAQSGNAENLPEVMQNGLIQSLKGRSRAPGRPARPARRPPRQEPPEIAAAMPKSPTCESASPPKRAAW